MTVDTSAILAILLNESEAERFGTAIRNSSRAMISSACYVEAAIRVDRCGNPVASRMLDEAIELMGITLEPVTPEQARIARAAYRDFGKGTGHPAQLNFGDCFSYALAKAKRTALLYKGEDFAKTDLLSAVSP